MGLALWESISHKLGNSAVLSYQSLACFALSALIIKKLKHSQKRQDKFKGMHDRHDRHSSFKDELQCKEKFLWHYISSIFIQYEP